MFIDSEFISFINAKVMTNPKSKYRFLDSLNLEDEIENRLSQHLRNIELGRDLVYMTPIAKDHDPKFLLSEWDKIFNSKKDLINDKLLQIEESNKSKFGPRSVAMPWSSRKTSTLEYFGTSKCKINVDRFSYDTRANLRPLSIENASKYIQKTSNSGLPYYVKKGTVIDKTLSKYNELESKNYPCILFTRTQEGGKTRDVWGYPLSRTLTELRYYQPVLDFQKKLNWRSALIGPHEVDLKISEIMFKGRKLGLTFISIDFSGFDKSVKAELQRAAFKYFKSLYQRDSISGLDEIEIIFRTIGLVTPLGIIEGDHGVPSGSTFTNEVDSVVQYLVAQDSGCIINGFVQIQGDDGVYALEPDKVDELFNWFERAGLVVNREKSDVSKDYCTYLQRLYHFDYSDGEFIGGIYSTYRALNRILFQERYAEFEDFEIKGRDYFSIRTISILENVKYHPLFKEFVAFIKKYDKYSLNFTQDGLNKFNNMNLQVDGNVGNVRNQYGAVTKGIRSFESYKLINI